MSQPPIDEAELQRILARAGLELSLEQVRSIMPGVPIVQRMIERVRAPLPREAEPAVTFRAEKP